MKHLLHGFSIALLIATAFLFISTQTVQGQNDCEIVAQNDTIYTYYTYDFEESAFGNSGWLYYTLDVFKNACNCTADEFETLQMSDNFYYGYVQEQFSNPQANNIAESYAVDYMMVYSPINIFEPVTLDYFICCDALSSCDTATVYLYPAEAVVAVDDYVNTPMNTPVEINVAQNDIIISQEGFNNEYLSCFSANFETENGTVTIIPTNNPVSTSCSILYTPNNNFVGTDVFEYHAILELATITIGDIGTVHVTVSNEQPQNTQIIFPPFPDCGNCELDLGPDQTTCLGASMTLTANSGSSYNWSTGATTQSINVAPSFTTTFSATVTSANGCVAIDEITIIVGSTTVEVGQNQTICLGENTVVSASSNNAVFYSWNTGATTQSINVSPSTNGVYGVTVTDANGCTAEDNLTVFVGNTDIEVGPNQIICLGESITVTATTSNGTFFSWNTGATTQSINVSPSTTAVYSVTVSDINGCTSTDNMTVNVEDCGTGNNQNRTSNLSTQNESSSFDDCIVTAQDDVFYAEYFVLPYWNPNDDGWIADFGVFLFNDFSSCNDDNLTFTLLVETIQNGEITSNPSNSIIYEYDNLLEPFTFDYTVCNNENICDTATVHIFPNEIIITENDYVSTAQNTPIEINVAQNDIAYQLDFDISGEYEYYSANENLDYSTVDISQPPNGTLSPIDSNGNYTYIPNPNFIGIDYFTYAAGFGFDTFIDFATVYITVSGEQQAQNTQIIFPPFPDCGEECLVVAEDDEVVLIWDVGVSVEVLTNDVSNCDRPLHITNVTQSPDGFIEIVENSIVFYFPSTDVIWGTPPVIYNVCDDFGNCDEATINIVDAGCCTPIANDDEITMLMNNFAIVNPLENDNSPCGMSLSASIISPNDNYLFYNPPIDFVGTETFTYLACNGGFNDIVYCCDTATITINVIEDPSNENRLIQTTTTDESSNLDCNFTAQNDTVYTSYSFENIGTSFGSSGNWVYGGFDIFKNACNCTWEEFYEIEATNDNFYYGMVYDGQPNPNIAVSDGMCYTSQYIPVNILEAVEIDYFICCDGWASCDTSTAYLYPDEIIVAEPDYVATSMNTPVQFNVTNNDILITDFYENTQIFPLTLESSENGDISGGIDGIFHYTPNNDFVGIDTFYYFSQSPLSSFWDTAAVYITVSSEQLSTSPCEPACSNTTAEYSVNPTAGSTYEWEIGGANNFISNNNEVQIDWAETGDGYIQMMETLADGTTNSTTVCIDIVATPTAQINTIPAATNDTISVCSGQNIQFSAANATDANEFLWIFGNGATATSQNTTFIYSESGVYETQLIANSDCMCSDTTSIFVHVDEAITPQIDCTGTVCRGDIMTYETAAVCGSYFWDISEEGTIIDGGTASDNFVMIHWLGNDNIGVIELTVSDCMEAYCEIPARYEIPIVGNENLNISGIDVVCSGDIAVYSVPNMSGISYNWNEIEGGTFLSGTTSNEVTIQWENEIEGDFFTPPFAGAFVSLEIENCFLGCSAQQYFIVDIRDVLDVFVPEKTACENESITMYSNILGDGATHPSCDWTITTPTQETIFIENEGVLADYEWQNGAGTYHIEIVPTNPSTFCNEKASTSIDVVSPPPAPTAISGETIICPAKIYNYSVPNNENYTFIWNVVYGNETTETEGNAINVNFNAFTTHTVSVAHQSKEFPFCQSEFITLDIVNLDNELELIGDSNICIYETATYTVEFSGVQEGVVWNVEPTSSAIVIDQNDTQLLVQWQNSGTVVATYCGATDSINVTVNALPEPEIVAPSGICFESSTNISTTTTYSNYTWYKDSIFYSNSPTPNLDEGGFYQVEVIDENGCFGSASKSIATYPIPEAFVSSPNFLDVCDDIFEINLYTAVSDAEPYHYQWYQNGLEVGTDTSHYLTPEEGNYHVVVTNIYGCSAISNTKIINADACPTGGGQTCTIPSLPTFSTTGEFCDSILFENTASGFIPNTTNWNFGVPDIISDISNLENPSYLYDKVGYYTVIMRVTYENSTPPPASCQVGVAQDIVVSVKADFEANAVCLGDTTRFNDLSTYLDGYTIASWSWISSNGAVSTAQNPQLVYEEAGEYLVTLEIESSTGCIDRKTKTIIVLPPPTAEINFTSQGCQNVAMVFEGQSNDNITKWEWNFGDENSSGLNTNIAVSQNATHIFGNTGIYEVSLTATNNIGCTFTTTQSIEIAENELFGEILLSNPSPMCVGDSTVLSFSEHNEGLNYQWSNGSTNDSITVFASNVYNLTVTDEIGCSFRAEQAIVDIIAFPNNYLYAEITQNSDDFSVAGNEVDVCFGSMVTIFAEESEEYSYLWSNNQTTSSIEIETEDLDTNENIYSLTITNEVGCESFADFTINLRDAPAEFGIISLAENNCLAAGENIALEIPNPQENLTYFWNNGTYGTSTIVAEGGTYFATAVNDTGCETNSNSIEIYNVPNAYMLQTGCFTECSPKEICLATSNVELSNYQWLLDGMPISNANNDNFMATENGVYQVEITSNNGCTSITDGLNLTLEDCSVCDVTATAYEDCDETTNTYSVYFSVSGGQAPYTITGSYDAAFNDTTIVQQSPAFDFNTPYEIIVTDALGCAFSFAKEENCITLPVELINFSGRMTENANLLEWTTASEINNDFFTLSRKIASENGFVAIAKIEANGNSSISKKYNYVDDFTEGGLVQYQLSQTDFDGTSKKVGTISLVRSARTLQLLEVSPVPTHDFVVIKYILPESRSESRLSLFDMHGRKVYEKSLTNNEQSQQQEVISLSQLSSGVYTLSLENGNERVIEKVVKY